MFLFILLSQFQPDGYNPPRDGFRGRDNFGTLRSHQGDNYRRDGFSTTRSVKKVYLWDGNGAADNQNMNQTNNLSNNLNNHHHSNNQQHTSMNIISSNSDKSNNLNSHHRSHHHHSNSNSSHGTNRMRRPPRQHVHRSDSPQNSSGSGSSPALSNSSSSPAPPSSPSPQESPKNCSYIYRDWLQFNTTPPSLMNATSSAAASSAGSLSKASMSPSKAKTMASTLQPKKSTSSPLSKIKFHSISKRRFSGQKLLNLNEKFQLINKKQGTSSSSFIGSDDYDYINYGTTDKSSGSGGKSSSLKKYFLKFAGDKTGDSNGLEAKNLFHLKRHHHYHSQAAGRASTSDENDFDVLNF